MAIVEHFAGSEAVSTTEWSLTTDTAGPDVDTTDGIFQCFIDLNALALGDTFEFRIYEKAQAAGTQRVVFLSVFNNAQGVDGATWVSPPLMLMHGWDMTLKRTAGSDRTITWSVRRDSGAADVMTAAADIQARLPAALTADGNIKADTLRVGGTLQTARDIGASVLLSAGSGAGQLDFTSGVVKANLAQILGTALTETAGLLAGGFKKFFNVATPTGTLNSIPDAVPDAVGGLPVTGNRLTAIPAVALVTTVTNLTNAPTAGDLTATMKTSVRTEATAATPVAASVTGNVGGNVVGSVASVTAGVTLAASAVQAIWDAATSALTTVGSIGKLLVDNINATISSRSSHVAADVWAVATRLLTAGTNIVLAKGTGVTGFNDLSAAQVNAEADTALADYDAPTHAEMTTELGNADNAVLAILGTPAGTSIADDISNIAAGSGLDAAGVRAALGMASADMDAQLDALPLVKAQTDKLTFGVTNVLNANITHVNGVAVDGAGITGDPWGPV